MLGYPAAALDRGRSGVMLARDLSHPGSIANAMRFLGVVHQLRGEVEAVHELAASTIELAAAHGLAQWLAFGRVLEAWIHAERGDGSEGVAQLRSAVDEYRSKGNDLWLPCFLALLATAHLKPLPRNYPDSCSQREPKRAKATYVRSADFRGFVCGALALVLI
jgi:predicted ATPase